MTRTANQTLTAFLITLILFFMAVTLVYIVPTLAKAYFVEVL